MDDPPVSLPSGGPDPAGPRLQVLRRVLRDWHVRDLIDFLLNHDSLWAVLAVGLFLVLMWRNPWGEKFGDLFEGRIADADIVAPFDVEIPDEARTAESREQARRAVNDVYVFDAKAADRLDRDLQKEAASGRLPGSPSPVLEAALTKSRGGEPLRALRQIASSVLSEMIVARRDTLPQGRAITVKYFEEPTEITLRELSRVIDLEEAKRRARQATSRVAGLEPSVAAMAGEWLASIIQPTLTYELGETRKRMDEAARQVPQVF